MRELIGIPYENRGTSLTGVDCWGLVVLYHRMVLKRAVPRYEGSYADANAVGDAITAGWVEWEKVELGAEVPGDVLAFRSPAGREVIHCGVVVDRGMFLHCLEGKSACVERYDRGMWQRMLVRIGRWNS